MEKTPPTVRVQISPEMNRWNIYATSLVRLALELHKTIKITSLTREEVADAGIVF